MTGPVQVIVVGFEQPSFSGEVLAELARLREEGVVRLVDVLLVSRDDDGSFETLPPPPGAEPGLGRIAAALLGTEQTLSSSDEGDADTDAEDSWSLADAVPPGGVAAVALIEHLWADRLVETIQGVGGVTLAEGWLSADDRARLPHQGA
jgi:uncharacterized membrane protein